MDKKVLLVAGAVLLALALAPTFYSPKQAEPEEVSLGPAPDFQLVNQFGKPVALSDFRGKVVVLGFGYTTCPTICPLMTSTFRGAADKLGDGIKNVAFIVVTVDPEKDTVQQVRGYSENAGMLNRWHFLTGEYDEVKKVWDEYGIYVGKNGSNIDHSSLVIIIDRQGEIRNFLPIGFTSEDLIKEINRLSRQ